MDERERSFLAGFLEGEASLIVHEQTAASRTDV
jgi:hypothetical protein